MIDIEHLKKQALAQVHHWVAVADAKALPLYLGELKTRLYTPAALKLLLPRLLHVMAIAQHYPDQDQLFMETMGLLQNHPLRYGFGHEWEGHLRHAYAICERFQLAAERAAMACYLGEIAAAKRDYPQAEQWIAEALGLAKQEQHSQIFIQATENLIGIRLEQNQDAATLTHLAEAEASLTYFPPADHARIDLHLQLQKALALRRNGRLMDALACIEQAIQALPHHRLASYELAELYSVCGLINRLARQYDHAIEHYQQAIDLFQASEMPSEAAGMMCDLGLTYWNMSQLALAENWITRSLTLAEQAEDQRRIMIITGNLALVYFSQGKLARALAYLEDHLARAKKLGITREIARASGNRGCAKMCLGQYIEAIQDLESREVMQVYTISEGAGVTNANLCCAYAGIGDHETAIAYAEKALQIARSGGYPHLEVISLRAYAQAVTGEQREYYLRQALKLATGHSPLDEAGCWLALCATTTDMATQADYWQRGVAILEDIGATDWLIGHSPSNPPVVALLL